MMTTLVIMVGLQLAISLLRLYTATDLDEKVDKLQEGVGSLLSRPAPRTRKPNNKKKPAEE